MRGRRRRYGSVLAAGLVGVMLFAGAAESAEFRRSNRLRTPGAAPAAPADAQPVENIKAIDPAVIEEAVRGLMRAWNTADLEKLLADSFFDKQRLLDAIDEDVPNDATIRILGIQSVQTLQQFTRPGERKSTLVISIVSATVRTQVEFNDPAQGFQRLDGSAEYLFEVTMRVGG